MINKQSSSEELISFCHILTTALKSGRPLPQSLLGLKEGQANNQAINWCRNIGKRLAEGHSLEASVKELSGFDPVLARLMPLFGEGRLVKILESYTRYLVIIESLNQKLNAAIFYPFVVLLLLCINLFHLNFFLFPRAAKEMLDAGREGSLLMKILFFADWHYWPFSLVVPLFLLLSLFLMMKHFLFGFKTDSTFLGAITGLNGIVRRQNAARAQAVVALYLESGLSLEKSLRLTAEVMDENQHYDLSDVASAIEHGVEVQDSFGQSPALRDVVLTRDSAENLSEVLARFSHGNYRSSAVLLENISNVSGFFALLLAGFFVLCVTSGFFNTYYWLLWSY